MEPIRSVSDPVLEKIIQVLVPVLEIRPGYGSR